MLRPPTYAARGNLCTMTRGGPIGTVPAAANAVWMATGMPDNETKPTGQITAPPFETGGVVAPLQQRPTPTALFLSFLRLGLTAFGGPAMVAYIRELSVVRKGWLDDRCFHIGVAPRQSIPGATAMQTAAYVGLRSAGFWGGLASYVGFGTMCGT